jgi:hypothetical protein
MDFELVASYALRVTATDETGRRASYAVTLLVDDEDDPPVITPTASAVRESAPVGTPLPGALVAYDEDADDDVVFDVRAPDGFAGVFPFAVSPAGELIGARWGLAGGASGRAAGRARWAHRMRYVTLAVDIHRLR